MIVSQCFWAELRSGVLSCCHLDFHRQIVGDGVYCGPVPTSRTARPSNSTNGLQASNSASHEATVAAM
jgi:hypothetical protein